MPTTDENETPEPGDLVIELRKGVPHVYTQPRSTGGGDLDEEDS